MGKAARLRAGGRRVRPTPEEQAARETYVPPKEALNNNSYDHTQPERYRWNWLVKR